MSLPCPACDAPVLTAAGEGEVCPRCGWPDLAEARADPEAAVGAPGMSLDEARRNVRRFGQAFPLSEAGGS